MTKKEFVLGISIIVFCVTFWTMFGGSTIESTKVIKIMVKVLIMSACIASLFFAPLGLIIWKSILEDIYDKD